MTPEELHGEEPPKGPRARIVKTIAYALTLAVVGHALWEMVISPGVHLAGHGLRTVLTLGSETVKNAPYESAAIDPTPLPGLLLMILAAAAATLAVLKGVFDDLSRLFPRVSGWFAKSASRAKLAGAWSYIASAVIGLGLVASLLTTVSVVNEAIVIWRVFHSNLSAVESVLPEEECRAFRTRFATMNSRAEFVALNHDMFAAAAKKGLRLRSPGAPFPDETQ